MNTTNIINFIASEPEARIHYSGIRFYGTVDGREVSCSQNALITFAHEHFLATYRDGEENRELNRFVLKIHSLSENGEALVAGKNRFQRVIIKIRQFIEDSLWEGRLVWGTPKRNALLDEMLFSFPLHLEEFPDEILLKILRQLNKKDLTSLDTTSKHFKDGVDDDIWKEHVLSDLGPYTAKKLKEPNESWRDLSLRINPPPSFFQTDDQTLAQPKISENTLDGSENRIYEEFYDVLKERIKTGDDATLEATLQSINVEQLHLSNLLDDLLLVAAKRGNIPAATLLIDYGAQDAIQDLSGKLTRKTALATAALNGQTEMVVFLLKKGAQAYFLFINQPKFVKSFLLSCIQPNGMTTKQLNTFLIVANAWKHSEYCLQDKIESVFNSCMDFLHGDACNLLIAGNFISIKKFQDSRDIDLTVGMLHYFIPYRGFELMEFFHRHGILHFTTELLAYAFGIQNQELLDFLIDVIGIPANGLNTNGETYIEAGKRLLQKNILHEISHKRGILRHYKNGLSPEILDTFNDLFPKGIDFNTPIYPDSDTVLHYLMQDAHMDTDFVRDLIRRGANPCVKNSVGLTPLDFINALINRGGGCVTEEQKTRMIALRDEFEERKEEFKALLNN